MKREKLVICEPEKAYRFLMRFNFKATSHVIVAFAKTLEESFERVDDIANNKLDCTTMIVDGHFLDDSEDCEDAHQIVNEVRRRDLGIALVGFCNDPLKSRLGVDVDYEVLKPNFTKLVQTLDSIKH